MEPITPPNQVPVQPVPSVAPQATATSTPLPTAAPSSTSPMSVGAKVGFGLLAGLVLGGAAGAAYFLFLAPKPEPVIVEKIVIQQATATDQTKNTAPAKVYDFHTIKLRNDDGSTTTLSVDNAKVTALVKGLTEERSNYYIGPYEIVVSNNYALSRVAIEKSGGGDAFSVVDLVNKKVTDSFSTRRAYYLDQGTFIFNDGIPNVDLRYYSYGASTSVKLPNSKLLDPETYEEFEGPMGSGGYQVVATTTNSITFGVFDSTKGTMAPGDDMTHYQKVGERMFIVR